MTSSNNFTDPDTDDVFYACDIGTQYEPSVSFHTQDNDNFLQISCSSQTEKAPGTVDVSCQTEHSGALYETSPKSSPADSQGLRKSFMLCSCCGHAFETSSTLQDRNIFFDCDTFDKEQVFPLTQSRISSVNDHSYRRENNFDNDSRKGDLDSVIERLRKKTKRVKSRSQRSFLPSPGGAFSISELPLNDQTHMEIFSDDMPPGIEYVNQDDGLSILPSIEYAEEDHLAIETDLFKTSEGDICQTPGEIEDEISMDHSVMKAVIRMLDEMLLESL